MGKLHTLRRAIERDPERWLWWPFKGFGYRMQHADRVEVHGAQLWYDGTWKPSHRVGYHAPYSAFVRHVLEQLGYKIQ